MNWKANSTKHFIFNEKDVVFWKILTFSSSFTEDRKVKKSVNNIFKKTVLFSDRSIETITKKKPYGSKVDNKIL